MSRGGKQATETLRSALEEARGAWRRYRQNDLSAPSPGTILDTLIQAVADALSADDEASEARPLGEVPTERPPPPEEPIRLGEGFKKPLTAKEKTVALPFSRPTSYCFDDKARGIRFTVTVEDLIA
jgi:hypothetical protein